METLEKPRDKWNIVRAAGKLAFFAGRKTRLLKRKSMAPNSEYQSRSISGHEDVGRDMSLPRRSSVFGSKEEDSNDVYINDLCEEIKQLRIVLSQAREAIAKLKEHEYDGDNTRLYSIMGLPPIPQRKDSWIQENVPDYSIKERSNVHESSRRKSVYEQFRRCSLEQTSGGDNVTKPHYVAMPRGDIFDWKSARFMTVEELKAILFSKEAALAKARQNICRRLNLSGDRLARLCRLRANILSVERKMQNVGRTPAVMNLIKTGASVQSVPIFEEELDEIPSRFREPGDAKRFFRKHARIIFIVLKWFSIIFDKQYDLEKELKSFIDIASDIQEETTVSKAMEEFGLSFDVNDYKANKEISLSQEVTKILTTKGDVRTPEMIKQVMHGLQTLQAFVDYPLQTQEKLCRVAWYQTVAAKKAIVRQGHYSESFYFIINGIAYVKKMIADSSTGESSCSTVARLTRGQSFGEIGLIFDSKRTATVESATPMELLVIGKEDFFRIFMNADNPLEDAEYIKFLKQLPLMRHWPTAKLREEPGSCILHYVKRGHVVTEDGKKSEWIYIVKTGSCEVLKKLRATKPRKSVSIRKRMDPMCDVILPDLGSNTPARVNTGKIRRKNRIFVNTEVFQEMTEYYNSLRRSMEEKSKKSIANRPQSDQYQSMDRRHVSFFDKEADQSWDGSEHKAKRPASDVVYRIPPLATSKDQECPGVSKSKFGELTRCISPSHFMLPTSAMLKKTQSEASERGTLSSASTTRDTSSMFVKVELLQPKDCFGLNTLEWNSEWSEVEDENIPSYCLVSKGAEVIMLSKKVFMKYASEKFKVMLRDYAIPYPEDRTMQENLQIKLDWDQYKSFLVTDFVSHSREMKNIPA